MKSSDFLKPNLPWIPNKKSSIVLLLLGSVFCLFLPWVAFTTGSGVLTSIDPNERPQRITAPVSGFVKTWHVREGQFLKKNDLIAELSDNDPLLLDRYDQEKEAVARALESARLMKDTAKINLDRQYKLFKDGLSSRKEFEKAKINFSKLEMEVAKSQVMLTKSESQYSKQSSQVIRAPRDGWVIRLLPGELGQLIKKGTPVAIFAPKVHSPAIEIWVEGIFAPVVETGQSARVQFEGWPSLQIPGWPSVAINTFPSKVYLVDQASSAGGKFRVLLVPDGKWPSDSVLRLGLGARGIIRLTDSYILREIWRQLNDIPALAEPYRTEVQELGMHGSKSKGDK